ncbi:hypothetical protein [Arenimonas caeni]|uniref:hypothetical protein n=1 Tax=Arenimonas caeni TaxID=2058085 RepID=UPI002A36D77C|nr:hypothetical protein [Arenimonas caeni]MDY0021165.1 hypothetical protein [Arenimonas caeni]
MILGYSNLYAADAVEAALPDPASARTLLATRAPDLADRLGAVARRAGQGLEAADIARHVDAALLGLARMGRRHGGFGDDPHDYHNEVHVMELAERRLGRVMDELGESSLPPADWLALLVFSACHDLRQREAFDVPGPVGGNEAASIAETFRILDASGFRRDADRAQYVALELMIAGSTFDARPLPHSDAEDLATAAGGSLARGLALWLDAERPDWTADPQARRGERLGRLAADLDTANVGEGFAHLAESALRLCRERERRAGRALDRAGSGPTCLGFLSRGQMLYFFDLHRFSSREGERVYGPGKAANAAGVRRVSAALLQRFEHEPPASGQAVLDAFEALCAAESG